MKTKLFLITCILVLFSAVDAHNGQDVKRDGLSGKSFAFGDTGDSIAQFFASEDRQDGKHVSMWMQLEYNFNFY